MWDMWTPSTGQRGLLSVQDSGKRSAHVWRCKAYVGTVQVTHNHTWIFAEKGAFYTPML